MGSKKKKINKVIIATFLWTALGGLGLLSRTKKWKSFFKKIVDNVKLGLDEMKLTFQKLKNKDNEKK
jgi:hypothetical protein